MNRVASVAAPTFMGGIAELIGIENSFYVIGLVVTVLMGFLVIHVFRSEELTATNEIHTDDKSSN